MQSQDLARTSFSRSVRKGFLSADIVMIYDRMVDELKWLVRMILVE